MKSSSFVAIFALVIATVMATPARRSRSITKCSQWTGTCMPGSNYNTASEVVSCKPDPSSNMSCQERCCVPFPAPDSNPAIITCAEKNQLDEGYRCDAATQIENEGKTCCRWSGECGTLAKCMQSTCCEPKLE